MCIYTDFWKKYLHKVQEKDKEYFLLSKVLLLFTHKKMFKDT